MFGDFKESNHWICLFSSKYFSNTELCHENDCPSGNLGIPGFYFLFWSVQACITIHQHCLLKFDDVCFPSFHGQGRHFSRSESTMAVPPHRDLTPSTEKGEQKKTAGSPQSKATQNLSKLCPVLPRSNEGWKRTGRCKSWSCYEKVDNNLYFCSLAVYSIPGKWMLQKQNASLD